MRRPPHDTRLVCMVKIIKRLLMYQAPNRRNLQITCILEKINQMTEKLRTRNLINESHMNQIFG